MIEQIELVVEEQNPTRWQLLLAWLGRFNEAMNYDPLVHAAELVRDLGVQVARLESRVIELERNGQRTK